MLINISSLGCPKNQADSNTLMRTLKEGGAAFTPDPGGADVLLVNTCCFIDEAKRESIDEILRLAAHRKDGKKLVVFGCLSERYMDGLKEEMPEVDAFFGVGREEDVARYCLSVQGGGGGNGSGEDGQWLSDTGVSVPLKVAEGCDRRCSFCVIPSIRGPFSSRRPEDILREAEGYLKADARELVLVAQDLTGFGKDLGGYGLPELLVDISSISGDFWVRPMYLHPSGITERLLKAFADLDKVCKYVDMPLQHSEERLLGLMARGGSGKRHIEAVRRIREAVTGVTMRTTMMVGFPGETEEEFEALLGFVREARFERLGAFEYSRQEGTGAFGLDGHIKKGVRKKRYEELMAVQAEISLEMNRALVGRAFRVLVEAVEGGAPVCRLSSQAPDIDGVTFVRHGGEAPGPKAGDFLNVKITGALHYDLYAEAV